MRTLLILSLLLAGAAAAQEKPQEIVPRGDAAMAGETAGVGVAAPYGARVKDIASVRGVRPNQISGLGLVFGLDGTGDSKSAPFTAQMLASALKHYNVSVTPESLKVKNVAAVMVTAELPPFAMPGTRIDVTVASTGDAASLAGGVLLQTPLVGPDGTVYAVAQGAISIGGFSVGKQGASVQKNHKVVGMLSSGAFVERGVPMDFARNGELTLDLHRDDFATAERMAEAIRTQFPDTLALALDGRAVRLRIPAGQDPVALVSRVQALQIQTDSVARITINERTGVVVISGPVRIRECVIAHGALKVRIKTNFDVSQPPPLSKNGETVVTPDTNVDVSEEPAKIAVIGGDGTATIDGLARALQTLGFTPQDLMSVLQAVKNNGALDAEIVMQ